MTILVNIIALLIIYFVVWWFWLSKKQAEESADGLIRIVIADGIYSPARVAASAAQPVILEFLRKDNSPCSEYVVFDNLDVHEQIPYNKPYQINLGVLPPGQYVFCCQMKMYQGELVVT